MRITPMRAIRQKCLECAGRPKDVRLCQTLDCPLFEFRLGRNPARAGIGGRKPCPASNILTQVRVSEPKEDEAGVVRVS
jgi:hypothetical protein